MSDVMSSTKRGWLAVAAVALVAAGSQLLPATALADPEAAETELQPAPEQEVLRNIIYRARIDGVSRGATITYAAEGDQVQTANPTMVPGRTFEANTVLPDSQVANMRVAIEWPYSANLHCEILVDDAVVAQADDFIAPRVIPQRDDPDYGAITCEAPVSGVANPIPADPAAPPAEGASPAEPASPADPALPPA
jgi:hypothetical protein